MFWILMILYYRFQRLHNPADIKKSILMLEEGVRLTFDGHPKKPLAARSNNLLFFVDIL